MCRKAHACLSFAATSLLTSLMLALLPTGQAERPPHPACLPCLPACCLSVCLSVCLPACLAVCLSVCLSVCLMPLIHAVASTVGAILVFPGASDMELGKSTPSPPFLTGLGWDLAVSSIAPTFAVCGCALLYLLLRNMIMRNEDPLHTVLWVSLPLCYG